MNSPSRTNLCLPVPRLERINYFYGQLLGVREFQAEQSYFREKLKLHNRYLHGQGVVCGLEVTDCRRRPDPCAPPGDDPDAHPHDPKQDPKRDPKQRAHAPKPPAEPAPDAPPAPGAEPPAGVDDPCDEHDGGCVQIECGLALDCCGNEVIVREPLRLDPVRALDRAGHERLAAGQPVTLWVSICFREHGVEPVRPLTVDDCGALLPSCVHARYRDDVCARLSEDAPCAHQRCSPCDGRCDDACVVLARIELRRGKAGVRVAVDPGVRRPVSPWETTRITGVSWVHGGEYSRGEANDMLTHGLVVHFSAPVHASTVQPGVLDVWAIEGGSGRRGQIYNIDGILGPGPGEGGEWWRSIEFRQDSDEVLQPGDRVLISLRTAFLLDRCCRPVDGDHVGGLVPVHADYLDRWGNRAAACRRTPPPCRPPEPERLVPWRSGNGTAAGQFDSWIWIADEARSRRKS